MTATCYQCADLVPGSTIEHYCVLMVGKTACCRKPYIVVSATFAPGTPDDAMRDRFFFRHADPGPETNFTASSATHSWTISRVESEQGPVLEHSFGPFAGADQSWIGPHSVSSCMTDNRDNPFGFARQLLANHWRDLEALYIETGMPRPTRPAPRPTKRPVPPGGDEIPF
jgi:hypothetical protein